MRNELRNILKRENIKFMMKRRRYFARIEWYFLSYAIHNYKLVFSYPSVSAGIFESIQANMKNISEFVSMYSDLVDQLCDVIERRNK